MLRQRSAHFLGDIAVDIDAIDGISTRYAEGVAGEHARAPQTLGFSDSALLIGACVGRLICDAAARAAR
jgi:hypothetical protein